jgi:large subunit ribosomal protein L24
MKKEFSKKWIGSRQTRKQRKYRSNAHLKLRHKMLSANLSKELRKKYGRRNFTLRKGDKVKIMKGEFKGKVGKVDIVDMRNLKASIEGMQKTKKEGTKINVKFYSSNLQIQELNLEDKNRIASLEKNKSGSNNKEIKK